MSLPATTVAALYKARWQVKLLFKWIKQRLRIKRFVGESENAVKTQIWCAVASYVLIAIIKKELRLDASLFNCPRILSASTFEKTTLRCALQPAPYRLPTPPTPLTNLICSTIDRTLVILHRHLVARSVLRCGAFGR